jgi:hypothetical protein
MMFDKGYEDFYPNVGFKMRRMEIFTPSRHMEVPILASATTTTTGGGSLELQATATDEKSKWRIVPIGGSNNMYNIRPFPGASGLLIDKQFVGADHWGNTFMTNVDQRTTGKHNIIPQIVYI